MSPRPYRSAARDDASAVTRRRILGSAARLLRSKRSEGFSLEAVAKLAGVTRLTVYHQFGSRRALLEAVFDDRAAKGGLGRIPEAMRLADPRAALDRLVEIFCAFWSSDAAVGRLHAAAANDPQF